jgi:hypothetical protein
LKVLPVLPCDVQQRVLFTHTAVPHNQEVAPRVVNVQFL